MPRTSAALGAVLCALLLAGACGGRTGDGDVGQPTPTPTPGRGDAGGAVASGLPCDVDQILATNCRECHSAPPRFGAPMPLMTWEDLDAVAVSDPSKKVREMLVTRIANDAHPMPPPPNERLSAADQGVLSNWVLAGGARYAGECTARQDGGAAVVGALSCTPNVTLEPTSAYEMPADVGDQYVCWGFDLARSPAEHVTAFRAKIDNTTIVHHIVLYESDEAYPGTPTPCDSGKSISWRMVLGWAPGVGPIELPPQVGFPVSADSAKPTHYVAQMHYSNAQRLTGQKDRSGVELCTSAPRTYEADVMAFGSQDFTIPAAPPAGGAYTIDCALTVPPAFSGLHLFASMPHMHKLGVGMTTTLTPKAGGPDVDLGDAPAFDFNSQVWLPIDATVKGGDVIRTKCSWVNDTGEPVRFGERTADEMCYSFTMYYPRIKSSLWSWAAPAAGPPVGATCTAP